MAIIDPVRPGIYMRYENIGTAKEGIVSHTDGGMVPPVSTETIVDTASFASLADAIAVAGQGEVLLISADAMVNEPVRVAEGQKLTLRIPAGVTLALDAGSSNYGLVIKGDVTVEGDGDIVLTGYGFGTSMNAESKLTIKGGHFIAQGCDYIIGCFDGEVVIEGGTFEGEYCVVNNFSNHYGTDGKVTIKGGTFTTSSEESYDVLGGPVAIRGGKFSKPVSEEHCAEGYVPADGEGYYTVVKG